MTQQALITGASSGIGKDVTKLLDKRFHVFACGRNEEKLQQLCHTQSSTTPLIFDINQEQQIASAAEQVDELDLLVLNAGNCEYIDDPLHFDAELFERVIKTNLISTGYCLKYFLPKVKSGGQVVFVGSSVTYFPFARAEAYGASKAGVNYLANALRQTMFQHNITVSLVEPGFVETPLTDKNDFDMPFLMSSEDAASRIVDGIYKKKTLIRFPFRLILMLKFLSILPASWSAKLTSRK